MVVVVVMAISGIAVAHSTGTARGASVVRWKIPFPQTISYRVLAQGTNVKCNQSDATFDSELAADDLDAYEMYVVAAHRGTCGRFKAEQLKRLHPGKLVMLYENPSGEDPTVWPGGTWARYYLMMNRTTALAAVNATQTQLSVANPEFFSVGDTAVMWWPTPTDAYANSEWLTIRSISGSTLTVTRNMFGTGAQSFAVPPLIAAVATGPSYPNPDIDLSDMAPVNPASGLRANQWMAQNLIADFAASSTGAPTLDAMELDSAASTPVVHNANRTVKNVDCDGDGIIDYCQRNVATAQQVDSYGVGYDDLLHSLKLGLAAYDLDPTRPPVMLIADGESGLRSLSQINGAEFESFPSWDDYTASSAALNTLITWQKKAGSGPRLSYAYTKDVTPLYPQPSDNNPNGCVPPEQGGTCRNGEYRYGMVAALLSGSGSGYNNEASYLYAQPWDEEATVDSGVTGLAPGYLGTPLGPPVRTTRYTSADLVGNGSFEQSLAGLTTAQTGVTGGLAVAQDTTTAAPGSGTASLRVDVTRLTEQPALSDSRVLSAISGGITPGEYTVDFWAKSKSTTPGPSALNLGIGLTGVTGAPQTVLVPNSWRHFVLELRATASVTKPQLKLTVGGAIGEYWVDALSVFAGSAGVVTRQYTNGIVVLNDSFDVQTDIALANGPYHHINGVQDRTVNDATDVGSLLPSVAPKDGVILLRG